MSLKHGADPNARNGVTRATPLVSALMGDREAQFHALLAAGADPNAADRTGNTPLHQAAKINQPLRPPDKLVTPEVRRGREAVKVWLRLHHIPIEDVPAH